MHLSRYPVTALFVYKFLRGIAGLVIAIHCGTNYLRGSALGKCCNQQTSRAFLCKGDRRIRSDNPKAAFEKLTLMKVVEEQF